MPTLPGEWARVTTLQKFWGGFAIVLLLVATTFGVLFISKAQRGRPILTVFRWPAFRVGASGVSCTTLATVRSLCSRPGKN